MLDGAVAKASGTASPRGAFFDSVADRFTDALLLGGVAWYLASTQPGRVAVLPFAVLALSMLISYERAKAESLGYDARGGLMERAERLLALGFGLLFDSLLVPVLWVMLVLTAITAVQRFVSVWRQASAPRPVPATTPVAHPPGCPHDPAGQGARRASPAPVGAAHRRRRSRRCRPAPCAPSSSGRPSPERCRGPVADVVGRGIGRRRRARSPAERRAQVERNLRRVHGPDFGGLALRRAVVATFESYARYYVDSFRLPGTPPEEIEAGITVDGWDKVEAALDNADGTGVILALPHLGGWEWAGFWVTACQGAADDRRRRGARAPRPLRVVRRAARGLRHARRAARARSGAGRSSPRSAPTTSCACCATATSTAAASRSSSSASARRCPAARRRWPCAPGAAVFPRAVYYEGEPPPRRRAAPPSTPPGRAGCATTSPAMTQDLAGELEELIRAPPSSGTSSSRTGRSMLSRRPAVTGPAI